MIVYTFISIDKIRQLKKKKKKKKETCDLIMSVDVYLIAIFQRVNKISLI